MGYLSYQLMQDFFHQQEVFKDFRSWEYLTVPEWLVIHSQVCGTSPHMSLRQFRDAVRGPRTIWNLP